MVSARRSFGLGSRYAILAVAVCFFPAAWNPAAAEPEPKDKPAKAKEPKDAEDPKPRKPKDAEPAKPEKPKDGKPAKPKDAKPPKARKAKKAKKAKKVKIDVLFSPEDGCAKRIVKEIGKAKRNIRVQAYYFTSGLIADALLAAARRGVEIDVILDGSQEKMTYARWRVLKGRGMRVYFDREHAVANNKIILIDKKTIITGSYNFTRAAEEKNAENVLFIKGDSALFKKYLKNFENHLGHAKKYSG